MSSNDTAAVLTVVVLVCRLHFHARLGFKKSIFYQKFTKQLKKVDW